jgi:hypothetical protein
MGLNWAKDKGRRQGHASSRSEADTMSYLREVGRQNVNRPLKRGPATLRCSCGHKGRVDTAKHKRFRCSKCNKVWWL